MRVRDIIEASGEIDVEQDINGAHHAIQNQPARIEELEAKLTIAMDGLVQSRDELDLYSQREYSGHPAYERYRKRDYDANPARIAIAKIKG